MEKAKCQLEVTTSHFCLKTIFFLFLTFTQFLVQSLSKFKVRTSISFFFRSLPSLFSFSKMVILQVEASVCIFNLKEMEEELRRSATNPVPFPPQSPPPLSLWLCPHCLEQFWSGLQAGAKSYDGSWGIQPSQKIMPLSLQYQPL